MNQPRHGVLSWRRGEPARDVEDELAVEEPLEVRVRGRSLSVTMRTPGHDAELAAGLLLSEGVVREARDIECIEPCSSNDADNVIDVRLRPEVRLDAERLTRHVFVSSSCGLCGASSIEAVRRQFVPVESDLVVSTALVASLPERLHATQAAFARTGGLHAAGVFAGPTLSLIIAREDVGRHNAVDKALGRALLDGLLPLDHHVLMVSGRASFEIVQKALAAGIPIVAAVSAPSSLAVALAESSGQTLVGFLRPGRMNVYAGAQRVQFEG